MISEVRSFIDEVITGLDPKFSPHREPNTSDNIGALRFEKIYWLEIISLSTSYSSNFYVDSLNCALDVAIKGGRDPIASHDALWCFALRLRDRIVANRPQNFLRCEVDSISNESILSQENWTRLRLQLKIEVSYHMRGAL